MLLLSTNTSRKDSVLILSLSIVNFIVASNPFKWFRNVFSSGSPCGHTANMSSTYLSQIFGLKSVYCSTTFSKFSIHMLLTTGDNGEPIAIQSVCWRNSSMIWKHFIFKHIPRSSLLHSHWGIIVSLISHQFPGHFGWRPGFKRLGHLWTGLQCRNSPHFNFVLSSFLILLMKCSVLFTNESVPPTRRERILRKCFTSCWHGKFLELTVGSRGIPFLCSGML
jgi:hypothetical protein